MKPRTAILLILIGLVVVPPAFFIFDTHNQTVLIQEFRFLGYSFSVARAMAILAVAAALLPSAFFTLKYTGVMAHARRTRKQGEAREAVHDREEEARALLAHGDAAGVLTLLEENQTGEAILIKAEAYLMLDDKERALELLETSFEENGHIPTGFKLAECLASENRSPEHVLQTLVEKSANGNQARRQLLEWFDNHQKWSKCLELAEALHKNGDDISDQTLAAYRYEALQASEETSKKQIDGFQKIIKEVPTFVPAYVALGELHLQSGSPHKALTIYEKAFKETENPVFLDRLEQFYMDQARPEDAISIYRELLVRSTGPLIKYQLGKLYYKLEMTDEALKTLEPLRHELGHLPAYLQIMSELHARRDNHKEVRTKLNEMGKALGFEGHDLICENCGKHYLNWQARCTRCRQWGTITQEADLVEPIENPLFPIHY